MDCDLADQAVHDREGDGRDHLSSADSSTTEEPCSAQKKPDDNEERTGKTFALVLA